jgi:ABC-type proline/glycine betaine transport system permease subunit
MDTLSQVLVAVGLSMLIALPVGVIAGLNDSSTRSSARSSTRCR